MPYLTRQRKKIEYEEENDYKQTNTQKTVLERMNLNNNEKPK
jgi:hypothetical protein